MNESTTHTVGRTGNAPLKFEGQKIATGSSHVHDAARWWNLALYRTDGELYVVWARYCSQWQGEQEIERAETCRDARGVRDFLRELDPIPEGYGFPEGDQYDARQRKLMLTMERGLDRAISEVLADLPFAPEIEGGHEDPAIVARAMSAARRQLKFRTSELGAICDACNGLGSFARYADDEHEWQFWPASVEDAIRLNGTDRQWEIDGSALMEKISRLTAIEKLAVADAIERFWLAAGRDHEPTTLRGQLEASGFYPL